MSQGKLSENAIIVAADRYFMEGEDWEACCKRVARSISVAENSKATFYAEKFAEMIYNMDFIPGGRILRNAGRPRGSMYNCYVISIGDSREEIGQYYKDSLILWGEGGGIGVNISSLRPAGAEIKGVGGRSSGPVSFLIAADAIAETIESGGSRRSAALALMNVVHPDVMSFIDAKLIDGRLPHFNISVGVVDEFLDAVESNKQWEFKFAHQSYGKMEARTIWDKIMDNMVKHAEPGLINLTNLLKNNSYYFEQIQCVNPCGEVPLGAYNCCNLGSLVLTSFITGSVNTNWKKMEDVIELAVRFLDDVIDTNKYVLKEIDINAHNSRRIGIGIMGLAEYLFAKKLRYGSKRAIYEVERLVRFIRDKVYEASVKIAIEKGSFPKFDAIEYGKASFIRKLPASLRMDIKKYGIRNVTLQAVAPTGTISLIAEATSGIEPLFKKAYLRHDRVSDRMYVHPLYKQMLTSGEEPPEWFVDTDDLVPTDHFEIQSVTQRYVDGAVSKTLNMPVRTTSEDLSKLALEYIRDLKGVTIYVDGSREGQILNKMDEAEIKQYIKDDKLETDVGTDSVQCASGSCEI